MKVELEKQVNARKFWLGACEWGVLIILINQIRRYSVFELVCMKEALFASTTRYCKNVFHFCNGEIWLSSGSEFTWTSSWSVGVGQWGNVIQRCGRRCTSFEMAKQYWQIRYILPHIFLNILAHIVLYPHHTWFPQYYHRISLSS